MESHNNNIISLASVRRERGLALRDSVIEALLDRATTMRQAALPLQQSLAHLEKDWKPRSKAFWQRQLRTLATLQEQVAPCIDLLIGDSTSLPFALRIARYALLDPLFLASAEAEKLQMHITAYLPLGQSHSEKSQHLRRNIVREMRELVGNVEEAVRLINDVHISQED